MLEINNLKKTFDNGTEALNGVNLKVKKGEFLSKPQKQKGRYYSFMPSALKEIAINNFNKFISGGLFNN